MYPDSESLVAPPDVDVLVGGNSARENQMFGLDATFNYHVPQK